MKRHRLYRPGQRRSALAVPVTLLALSALLVMWGCEAGNQDGDIAGPLFAKEKPCTPWPQCNDGGGDGGGVEKGDPLTVDLADGMVTPSPQDVKVSFINKTRLEVYSGNDPTFTTATNLDSTQTLANNVDGPCVTQPADAAVAYPAIVDALIAGLVEPQRPGTLRMMLDKRGLDAPGDSSQSFQNRLSFSWREAALEDSVIIMRVATPGDFGHATVVLDNGSFDNVAGGLDLTIKDGTVEAFNLDNTQMVTLLCPNVDEFKVFVRVPTP